MEFIVGIARESVVLFLQMSPYLLLGFVFAGILHVFVSLNWIAKHLGKHKIASILKAVLLGIPLPLCSCGVLPAAIALRKKGANRGAVISFLIATPITGVDSMLATYALMGGFFTIYRIIASSIVAIVAGFVSLLILPPDHSRDLHGHGKENCPSCRPNSGTSFDPSPPKTLTEFFRYTFYTPLP